MPTPFEILERGVNSSQPSELYRFLIGDQKFCYTRDRVDVTYLGDVYRAVKIMHEGYEGGADPNKAQMNVLLDLALEVSQMILNGPPSEVIFLSVFRGQRGLPGTYLLSWSGEVMGNAVTEEGAVLTAADATQSQLRNGLMMRWQRMCGYGIYEEFTCKASRSFRQVDLGDGAPRVRSSFTTDALKSTTLIAAGKMVDELKEMWFVGGYVQYQDDTTGLSSRRTIIAYDHTTGTIGLHPNMSGYANYTLISVFPGCAHNTKDCDLKHNNLLNSGADPFIPVKNVFDPGEGQPW